MKSLALTVALFLAAGTATAQPQLQRPTRAAPAATASTNARVAWCDQYATWLLTRLQPVTPPTDARATHQYEMEFNACRADPRAYERETRAEAQRAAATGRG